MNKIRKGDEVIVTTGRDKGRRGKIGAVLADGTVIVEGANLVKKHQKGNPNTGASGGIVEKEMPIDISNVALWNPAKNGGKGGPDRVGIKTIGEGDARRKVRFFKSTDEVVDA